MSAVAPQSEAGLETAEEPTQVIASQPVKLEPMLNPMASGHAAKQEDSPIMEPVAKWWHAPCRYGAECQRWQEKPRQCCFAHPGQIGNGWWMKPCRNGAQCTKWHAGPTGCAFAHESVFANKPPVMIRDVGDKEAARQSSTSPRAGAATELEL